MAEILNTIEFRQTATFAEFQQIWLILWKQKDWPIFIVEKNHLMLFDVCKYLIHKTGQNGQKELQFQKSQQRNNEAL